MDPETEATCRAVLPPGISLVEGDPPAAPLSFGDEYTLPQHYEKPLQRLHSHPLDTDLVFYEVPHVYTWKGIPTTTSVTGLAHEHEKPFEPYEAIRLMKHSRSQAWPRLEYVHDAKPLTDWSPARGALMVCGGKTVSVVQPHCTDEPRHPAIYDLLCASVIKGCNPDGDDDVECYTYERELSTEEIVEKWKAKGTLASHMGTEAHFQAELMLNGLPFRYWEGECRVLLDFVRDHLVPNGIVSYATEKEIVCVDADVAGSIDAIVYDPVRDVYHIIDHKRTDKLAKDLRGYGKMSPPFAHLDDCKGAAYALQTSIYQYILERDYGMRIGERILLSLHPDKPFCTSVPYLKAEVEWIMQRRFALVQARRRAAEEDPHFRCSLTGAPAVDAVRLSGGEVAMEKAAIVASKSHTAAADVRLVFEKRVNELLVPCPSSPPPEACVSWRKVMPEGGIVPFR